MKTCSLIVLTLMLLTMSAWADDGKTIASRDGSCQATVPSNWVISSLPGMADSPDKKISIVISSPKIDSFATLKENSPKVYAESKVTKNAATEFEMEGQSMNRKPNVYRGIAGATRLCIGEVIYESGTVEEARKLVRTLKAK